MAVITQPPGYRSYLLRIWGERNDQAAVAVWRFSLEDPHTGQRHGFSSLEALAAWIRTELAGQGSAGLAEPGPTV